MGGKPHPDYDMADWVLGRFDEADAKKVKEAVSQAADAVELLLKQGMDAAMARYNG